MMKIVICRKDHVGETIYDLKLDYRTMVTCYCHKNRSIGQWSRIENPEINSYNYSHLIFNKVSKTHIGKKTVYSTNHVRKTGYPYRK